MATEDSSYRRLTSHVASLESLHGSPYLRPRRAIGVEQQWRGIVVCLRNIYLIGRSKTDWRHS
ncbi:MAG: hypothetical protein NVS3B14_15010 [Ktedonobacteraceae bacterium]